MVKIDMKPSTNSKDITDILFQGYNKKKHTKKVPLSPDERMELLQKAVEKPIRELTWHLDNFNEKPTEKNINKIKVWMDNNALAMKLLPDDINEKMKKFKLNIDYGNIATPGVNHG